MILEGKQFSLFISFFKVDCPFFSIASSHAIGSLFSKTVQVASPSPKIYATGGSGSGGDIFCTNNGPKDYWQGYDPVQQR